MFIRSATPDDLPVLRRIMDGAIDALQSPFLTPEQVVASREFMGLDTQLVEDGTYFACMIDDIIVGCGGWSYRSTLFGGDHSAGRDKALLDPESDPARVRAMYTHSNYTRRGVGMAILEACEKAAKTAGFTRTLLVATLSGEKLYSRAGYASVKEVIETASNGVEVPFIHMEKSIS